MPSHFCSHKIICALALPLILLCALSIRAQTDEAFGDEAADPVKLFERGQDAHAKGDFKLALEFYEGALKVRPEFPEAEYQKGAALFSLERLPEAERAFRRAAGLRKDWSLPHVALGSLLMRTSRDREAEPFFRRAIELDAKNSVALLNLATLRARSGATNEAVELARRATTIENAPASVWAARGMFERAAGDKRSAATSLDRALSLDPNDINARAERAELRAEAKDFEGAIEDLKTALRLSPSNTSLSIRLARFYSEAGQSEEALRILDALDGAAVRSSELTALRNTIAANSENEKEARVALEKLLASDPHNALVLARLGSIYRTIDPQRSLEYYRRAAEIEPRNVEHATGYAAALVQGRRFAEAATILRRIIAIVPDSYVAHANLATALDELKRYDEALAEYRWINQARPDLAITHFFIARDLDLLGEYEEALAAYETFLARADAQKNQLELEKVKLRLPSLRNQIKRGEGSKRKRKDER